MTRKAGEKRIIAACARLLALIAHVRGDDPYSAIMVRFEERVVFCSLDLALTERVEAALRAEVAAYGADLAEAEVPTNVWTN